MTKDSTVFMKAVKDLVDKVSDLRVYDENDGHAELYRKWDGLTEAIYTAFAELKNLLKYQPAMADAVKDSIKKLLDKVSDLEVFEGKGLTEDYGEHYRKWQELLLAMYAASADLKNLL